MKWIIQLKNRSRQLKHVWKKHGMEMKLILMNLKMLQEIQDNNQISPDNSDKLVDILGNLDELNNNFNLKSRETKRTLFHIQDI